MSLGQSVKSMGPCWWNSCLFGSLGKLMLKNEGRMGLRGRVYTDPFCPCLEMAIEELPSLGEPGALVSDPFCPRCS